MRKRRFLPSVGGAALEPRLPLDGDIMSLDGDATIAVGPQPEADPGPMGGVLDANPPAINYDQLLQAIEPSGPTAIYPTSAFD